MPLDMLTAFDSINNRYLKVRKFEDCVVIQFYTKLRSSLTCIELENSSLSFSSWGEAVCASVLCCNSYPVMH